MYARMADPETPAGKKWLEERSPLFSAAKIKTPLLVVQGANDPRVNRREAEQIVIALRDRGFPVEYLLAPDEGHGFARPVNNLAMFMAVEKFLARTSTAAIRKAARRKWWRACRKSRSIRKPWCFRRCWTHPASAFPKSRPICTPGTYKYDAKLSMGDQQMALKLSTTIQDAGGAWTAEETMDTPMGEMLDTVTLEKGSLTVSKRSVKQGPVAI